MLTVECVSVAGSTHSAAAWKQNTVKKSRHATQAGAALPRRANPRRHSVPPTVSPCISPYPPLVPQQKLHASARKRLHLHVFPCTSAFAGACCLSVMVRRPRPPRPRRRRRLRLGHPQKWVHTHLISPAIG